MARGLLVCGLLAAAALAHMQGAAAQSTSPPFPRLGGVLIAGGSVGSNFGTPSFQQLVAKVDVAVIGIWPGWSAGGFTASSAAAAVKAINPNIKLFPYTNLMELEPGVGAGGSAYSPIFDAVSANNWFLRTAWPSGSITDADGNAQQGLNQTNKSYLQWRAGWTAANEITSNWDGIYLDNVFEQPRVSADYNQSGSSQSPNAAGQNWRNGYATYVGLLRAALPAGRFVIGNTADWANGPIPEYNQMLDGGVMEALIGESFSYENRGWAVMMNTYKIIMNATAAPGYQIFAQDGSTTDYQSMRYGLASCLLDNGYYYHSNGSSYDTIPLYDEFSFKLGAPAAGPAGSASATYSNGGLTVWNQGVWRRDFANGIALVNPKGNGTRTVTLETSYKHLSGTQDPAVNNGQSVTTVTLNDRDGVILQRLTSQPVPDAPSLTVQ